jgi:PTS system ascorbate-specific IIC component
LDILNYWFDFIAKEILGVPAYLVGLMTLIGLIASRKKLGEIIGGSLKATLGFIILGIGAGAVIGALDPLGALITGATGAEGVVPTNEAITAIVANTPGYASNIAYAMFFGVVLALILARVTNLRYVFLTGHHMLFMATVLVVVMLAGAQADALWAVAVGAIGLATMMVVMPAFAHPWMKKVTGGEKVGMGHFGSFGYISAGFTGQVTARFLGKGRSTEELNIPESLRFLRDPMVGTAVAMIIIYLLLAIIFAIKVGVDAAITATSGGVIGGWGGYLMAMFNQALIFGGGVAVILLGVRTILGEIVPAFAGIAERVIPGAVPALDCPVSFPYAPNAVIVGFLFSVIGGLAGLVVLVFIGKPLLALAIVIPGMIPHFFTGGTAGVFGNATGGTKGAMAGGFINGFLITILAAFLLGVMGGLGALAGTTFGDTDFQWFGIIVGNIAGFMKGIGGAIAVVVVCAVLIGVAMWWQARFVDKGWVPGGTSEDK